MQYMRTYAVKHECVTELLYCIGDDSADSNDPTFSVTDPKSVV